MKILAMKRGNVKLATSKVFLAGLLAATYLAWPARVSGQGGGPDLKQARNHVLQGRYSADDVNQLRLGHAIDMVPALANGFAAVDDTYTRDSIAATLVALGASDARFWDYLQQRAEKIAEGSEPPATKFDSAGKRIPSASPEFLTWARANKLSEQAAIDRHYEDQTLVFLLAETKDQRAIPLLRKILRLKDSDLILMAAIGLAKLHDEDSVPQILEVTRSAPAELQMAIAGLSLSQFRAPEAQEAAKRLLPPDVARDVGKIHIYDSD